MTAWVMDTARTMLNFLVAEVRSTRSDPVNIFQRRSGPRLDPAYYSSSWMMIRGVTIIIRLCASRPTPTLLNNRFM